MSTAAATPALALHIAGLAKRYGAHIALDGFYLDIAQGEIVALIGPSGCGKSTLLRCVTWLTPPDDGFVEVGGEPIGRLQTSTGVVRRQTRREIDLMRPKIGLVYQDLNLWAHLSALENIVRAQVVVLRRPRREAEERARELLGSLGLEAYAKRYPFELSGGQKQRVAIARTLAMDPALMLFDEPTSALDPELVGEMLALLKALAARGTTMLVVTHSVGFAAALAHRVAFMDAGRVVEEGETRKILGSPQSARLRAFLASTSHTAVASHISTAASLLKE